MEEEKKTEVEEVKEEVKEEEVKEVQEEVKEEASTNPEDLEGQTTVEELDVRECEEVDGGDVVEATEDVAE